MSEVLDDNLEKEENSNGFQLDFEEITPWNGANDTGKDVRMKAPAFKLILTATGEYAFRRPEDGIYVVPIGCLKP